MVFEGMLSTDIPLHRKFFPPSAVALCAITFPIAISLVVSFGYGYSTLQAFGAGAALCSTSLGATASHRAKKDADGDYAAERGAVG